MLLVELLRLIAPYAEMVQDVLAFFARAGAQSSSENIRIRFEFDNAGDNFEFDLRNFRDWESRFREVVARVPVPDIDDLRALELRHAFVVEGITYRIVGSNWTEVAPSDIEVGRWLDASPSGRGESPRVPPPPRVADADLKRLLALVWLLLRGVAGDAAGGTLSTDDVRTIVRGAYLLREHEALLLRRLRDVFDDVSLQETEARVQLEELFEVFNLPAWKRRSELYSVWVGARLMASFGERARVHVVGGSLAFSFGGAHLATVAGSDGPAAFVWCEFRSRASALLGKGRKRAIQPDYVLLGPPVTHPDSAILVVECKQYLKQSRKAFAHALIDYARGHRSAVVALVSYGPLSPSVLEHVAEIDPSLVGRTRIISQLRPGSTDAVREFEDLVRSTVPALTPSVGPALSSDAIQRLPGKGAGTSGTVRISWQEDVDLDLHCWVTDAQGQRHHIYYECQVLAQAQLRVELSADIQTGGGAETLTWTIDGEAMLEFAVHAYTDGSDVAHAGAMVEIYAGGLTWIVYPPRARIGKWWKLLTAERGGSSIRIWDSISGDLPFVGISGDPKEA